MKNLSHRIFEKRYTDIYLSTRSLISIKNTSSDDKRIYPQRPGTLNENRPLTINILENLIAQKTSTLTYILKLAKKNRSDP